MGSVSLTVTGVTDCRVGRALVPVANGEARMSGPGKVPSQAAGERFREVPSSVIPTQRNAADAYRVSEDQVHRARIVVARNAEDPDDCRQLLEMLGLLAGTPDQPPPVCR